MASFADEVYVPTGGDIRGLSEPELLALIAKAGLLKEWNAGNDSREAIAQQAAVQLLSIHEIKALIRRAGLSDRDCSELPELRARGLVAIQRLEAAGVHLSPRRGLERRESLNHFPATWKRFDVVFKEAALGFSCALDEGGNVVVTGVSGDAAELGGLRPNDRLVAVNDMDIGSIDTEAAFHHDVVDRLKLAPRAMRLWFIVGDGRWPPTIWKGTADGDTKKKAATAKNHKTQDLGPVDDVIFRNAGSLGFAVKLTMPGGVLEVSKVREVRGNPPFDKGVRPGDAVVAIDGKHFDPLGEHNFPAVVAQLKHAHRPMTLTFALRNKKSHHHQPATTPSPTTTTGDSTKGETNPNTNPRTLDAYRYTAIFPKDLLGIALALSKSVGDDTLHVEVTEVRPTCVVQDVEVHDRLVEIEGKPIGQVTKDMFFKILKKLKAAPRPLTLTFSSGVKTVVASASYAQALFDEIDVKDEGFISQLELIKALRKNEALAACLHLPRQIRQEDGSRDLFAELFHKLAVRDDKKISKREWAHGLAQLASETIV